MALKLMIYAVIPLVGFFLLQLVLLKLSSRWLARNGLFLVVAAGAVLAVLGLAGVFGGGDFVGSEVLTGIVLGAADLAALLGILAARVAHYVFHWAPWWLSYIQFNHPFRK